MGISSCHPPHRLTIQLSLPGPLAGLQTQISRNADPVGCSDLFGLRQVYGPPRM